MELEKLTKSQIILLALLVSFVSSITTGVVVISLMEQAPKDITRVVQRTVVKTVEKVTPPEVVTKVIKETVQTPDRTQIVKDSINKITPSVVSIYLGDQFLSKGVAISNSGLVATDAKTLSANAELFTVKTQEDTYEAQVVFTDEEKSIALLLLKGDKVPAPASIYGEKTELGMPVILISGKNGISVSEGIVSELSVGMFKISVSDEVLPGSVVVVDGGAVLGISTQTARVNGPKWFLVGRSLLSAVSQYSSESKQSESEEENTDENSTSTQQNSQTQNDESSQQAASAAEAINSTSTQNP